MPMRKQRLDTVLVERGLVPSRERARALILAGQVLVDGRIGSKAGADGGGRCAQVAVKPDHPYVGRGGVKLAHALETFRHRGAGRRRSTSARRPAGSPTCCSSAARAVVALDVGHGQLDWRLRTLRGSVVRRVNARTLTPKGDVPSGGRVAAVRTRDDRRLVHLAAAHPAGVPGCSRRARMSSRWSSRSSRPAARSRQTRDRARPRGPRRVIARGHRRGGCARTLTRGDDAVADHGQRQATGSSSSTCARR